jgi:hypothetical protein
LIGIATPVKDNSGNVNVTSAWLDGIRKQPDGSGLFASPNARADIHEKR